MRLICYCLPALAMLLTACQSETAPPAQPSRQIGYAFYSSLDPVKMNSSANFNSVDQGILHLFERVEDESLIYAAWTNWPEIPLQASISDALGRHLQVRLQLIVDGSQVMAPAQDTLCYIAPISLQLSNRDVPNAGILNPSAKLPAMHANFLLFRNLKPEGADDGAFNILLLDAPFSHPAETKPITEALRIYGDSSLFERYFAYWEAMREGKTSFTFATSHTYSNLHDHQAWFFPDINATAPDHAHEIWKRLDIAIKETHQPAKIRLVVTGADLCHADFFQQLGALYNAHEADIKLILPDTASLPRQMDKWLQGLPQGSVRIFPAMDSTHHERLASRFLLIDGPYQLTENEPSQSRRMCFFFGEDFNLDAQRSNSATWMRITDERVFKQAEAHWNKVWKMSEEKPIKEATRLVQQKRCPWK